MRFTKLVTPVTSSDWDNRELGKDDSATDGGGDFLAALHTESDVAIVVTDGHEGLEPRSLSSPGLLLDRHDLQNLVL